jgi:hypothetical protein
MTLPYFCTFVIIPPLNSHHARNVLPSLIEVGQVFHFKRFFSIYTCKNSFPSCLPPWPSGTIIICNISESFHVNMSFSGSVVLKENIFNDLAKFSWLSPLWRGPGPLLEQFKILYTQGWFVPSLTEIGLLVLEKIVFRYKQKWIWFYLLSSLPTPGDHDLKKLESTLNRKAFM